MASCVACGFEAPAEFAFCPKCGRRLGASSDDDAQTHADRRPVTVLFADLSGFTALSERLDPEDVRALQSDLYNEMSATIERFDGFVEKYVGDAVMAVFGAPVAHDEDPERAVRAAIVMQERVAALSDTWMPRLGQPLALHIGINTGPVVAGRIGANSANAYAVTGDTVNAASRLQSAAGPAQILVSLSTYLLTQHAFRFESLGGLSLKGKAQPLAAYLVEAALATPSSTRGLLGHGLAAPLIGRDRELDRLAQSLQSMLAGRTQLVSIVADAGTGKTRLLSEFLARLQAEGQLAQIAVRSAACSSLGERTYGVPAALLRDAYNIATDDQPEVAREKIAVALLSMGADAQETERVSAFLAVVLGLETQDAARHLDPEQLQRQVFLAVRTVVERRLQLSSLLLIVEDLHWTDAASVELLRFLLDALPDRQFMLLVTHRPSAELDVLGAGQAAHTCLRLEPLSQAQSERMLGALFGASAPSLPGELRARIVEHAGGNPLFLEELVRALIAEGVLQQHQGRWAMQAASADMKVPLTIHGLLLARIDRLPRRARQVMLEAAVIGPVFAERLLSEVAADRATLPQALDLLVSAGLISPVEAERRYRFRHGLFQEVAYENLLARRRTELHTRIGEVLERECGAAPQRLEELEALAHHFRLSSDKARGVRYLVLAGDWARSMYANADAIRHYELALQTLDANGDASTRLAVQERLGDVLGPVGQSATAKQHLAAALEGHARSGDSFAQARVLRKLAALHWETGAREEARRCLESGLALIDEAQPHIERAKLYQEMGQLAFRSGDNVGAMQWTQRALDGIERLAATAATDDERRETASTIALTLNTQGVTLARLDRLEDSVAQLERSVAIAGAADLPQAECRALSNLGVLYSSRDPRRAIDACERGLQTARRVGDLGLQSRLYANLAVAYCTLTNRCDERGVGAANTAIEIDRRAGQLDHLAVSLAVLAQIYQCHGEPERALGHYREALALAETSAEPQLLFPCYDGLATLYLDLDDYAEAERYMQLARSTCERAGLDPDAFVVLPFLT